MEEITQILVALAIFLTFALRSSRRRGQEEDTEKGENTVPEGEVTPPPFMENFPFETQLEDMIPQQEEAGKPPITEEPVVVAVQEPVEPPKPQPPPVPVESSSGIRSVPATALLDLSPQTFRQGVILREILGRPRSRQRGAPFQNREI